MRAAPALRPATAGRRPRILVTQRNRFHPKWSAETVLLPGWLEYVRSRRTLGAWQALWSDVQWAIRLLRFSRDFDVVLTGAERSAIIFGVLRRLLRKQRPAHILLECMFNLPAEGCKRLLRSLQLRIVAHSVDRLIVWSRKQVGSYASLFGIPPEKLVWAPFHDSAYGAAVEASEGEYIFAGGDSNRDYLPLIEAAAGLPWPVIICVRDRSPFRGITVPPNVQIGPATSERFLELMAGSGVVVVPLRGGLLHSGGHQTYLNAMRFGKPVVVADDCGADEYIEHGVTGLVVPPGKSDALQSALQGLIDYPGRRRLLGANARIAAENYSLERYIERVLRLAEECVREREERQHRAPVGAVKL